MCQFYESMVQNGYNRFRSVADETRFMGFNRKGRPMRATATPNNLKCLNFMKLDQKFDIGSHNIFKNELNRVNNDSAAGSRRYINNRQRQVPRTTPRIRHKNHHRNYVTYP